MSDPALSKLKSLKESLNAREKLLLSVLKELDHYRLKCNRLKLLLLKQKASSGLIANNIGQEKPQTKDSVTISHQNIVKAETEDGNAIEDGEIKDLKKPKLPAKRKRKSLVTKFMESITSCDKHQHLDPKNPIETECKSDFQPDFKTSPQPVIKTSEDQVLKAEIDENTLNTIESILEKSRNTSKPALKTRSNTKKAAYNKPYNMTNSYTEINYTPIVNQPLQNTPMTVSLSQINPKTLKFKEFFEICKKLYCSDYEFNLANLSILTDILKTLDPSTASTYFVNEMMQCSYLFSPQDALSIVFGVTKEINDLNWIKSFLVSFQPFFLRPSEDIYFIGKETKLPFLKYPVNTLQEILHIDFVLISKQLNCIEIVAKLVSKLLAAKNVKFIKKTFEYWEESVSSSLSMKVLYRLIVAGTPCSELLTELSEQLYSSQLAGKDLYRSFKGILLYIPPQQAYESYQKYLWPSLEKKSSSRTLVIKIIGVLYLILEKEGTKKVHNHLKTQLEEILTDKKMTSNLYSAFSLQDQRTAADVLEKIGFKGKTLENWKKLNDYNR
jgi:hypothetical protein